MTSGNITREEARLRSRQLAVDSYRVTLDLSGAEDLDAASFPVSCTITFTSTDSHTWLDFIGERVDQVEINEVVVPVDYDGARIRLDGLKTDAPNRVTVAGRANYSTSGQGLHRFTDPSSGRTYTYTHHEPTDARRVFPNFEQPDLKARFELQVHAPADWQVYSNQEARDVLTHGHVQVHWFSPTPPLSSYLTALVAGPYHRASQRWQAPGGRQIELGFICRPEMAAHLDIADLAEVTKQGLGFFEDAFDSHYAWGKYDQAFVPEFNIGAMENPGCVVFAERYLFQSAATTNQYSGRAVTLLHEMSHMWFGGLVTPQWWDDLWLKESFAEFMGTFAAAEVTRYRDAWVDFAGRRKAWAYQQDQLPTTHPVVAAVPDTQTARQAFDGITYAKGAAVVRQLVAFMGLENFLAGVRDFFHEHAYGTATFADLLEALEENTPSNLQEWAGAWLQTCGVDELRADVQVRNDRISWVNVHCAAPGTHPAQEVGAAPQTTAMPESLIKPAGDPLTYRPHRVQVGFYRWQPDEQAPHGGRLTCCHRSDVIVHSPSSSLLDAIGLKAPDLVLINDGDLSYVKTPLDATSQRTLVEHLAALEDPLARAVAWSALWDGVRDAIIPVERYLTTALRHGRHETDSSILRVVLDNLRHAIERFLPVEHRNQARANCFDAAWQLAQVVPGGSDAQLLWARFALDCAAGVPGSALLVRSVLRGVDLPEGLVMDADLRWRAWKAVAALGVAGPELLDDELARDNTSSGAMAYLTCLTARPNAAVKRRAWQRLHTVGACSNEAAAAIIAGFHPPQQDELVRGFAADYFPGLLDMWRNFPSEMAEKLVKGLYPRHSWLCAGPCCDDKIRCDGVVQASVGWLDDNRDAPAPLRRLIIECQDELIRSLLAQEYNRDRLTS